jgi:hypothetical protein
MGVAAGDVNNDGWCDLLVTEYVSVRLLVNRGGAGFEVATAGAGGWLFALGSRLSALSSQLSALS